MVFFRVDSNKAIAGGHVMRCLAIAQSLIAIDKDVCFLCADDNATKLLDEASMPYVILNSDWKNLMTDVDKVKDIICKEHDAILLIDTYQVTREYIEYLEPYCRIAYLGSKKEYLGKIDLLINYSADIDYEFYNTNYGEDTNLLLGPSYAPLRKEFQNIKPIYRKSVERILVTTGNTDGNNVMCDILDRIVPIAEDRNIIIDVVIGRLFDNKDSIHAEYDDDYNVCLHENVSSMSSLMRQVDMAISANGTTVYELSAVGVPTISFAMVKEQYNSAKSLSELGIVDFCGKIYEDRCACVNGIVDRVLMYIQENDKRIDLAKKANNLISGNGCKRIIESLV